MKLRNKKTGEIIQVIFEMCEGNVKVVNKIEPEKYGEYSSLEEIRKEWEDYEEQKDIQDIYVPPLTPTECIIEFRTEEEAEKAVEKLKAWKRLKDKGFRFERWLLGGEYGNTITFAVYFECDDEARKDLDLLFGGEE